MMAFRLFLLASCVAVIAGCGTREATSSWSPTAPDALAPTPTDGLEGEGGHDGSRTLPLLDIGGGIADGARPGGAPVVLDKVVVRLAPGETLEDFNAQWGTTTDRLVEGSRFAQLDLPGEGGDPWEYVGDMARSPECEIAEPLYVTESPESQQGTIPFFEAGATPQTVTEQWAMDLIQVPAAHTVATGTGIRIAIVDTGIDYTHPDLAAVASPIGRDYVDDDMDPRDVAVGLDADGDGLVDEAAGHGTHVAGLVHAVAPGATLLAVRVLDSEGNGTSVNVARGIRWAADVGADVINLSLGMYSDAGVIKEAIDEAVDMGIVVVAAMGNRNLDDSRHFPSRLSHVIAVAATDSVDHKADFSNYGSPVRVSAPGVSLVAPWLNHGYASWSGTSMSVPLVSGAAALYLQIHPWMPPADVAQDLEDTAQPLPPGYVWSDRMGGGRLDLLQLLAP